MCQSWIVEAEALLENKGSKTDGLKLLDRLKDDEEGNFSLITNELLMNVTIYTFKKIFKVGPIRVKKVPTEYL